MNETRSALAKPTHQKAVRLLLLQGKIDLALESLRQAINLNVDKYRELAITISDFDGIRQDERFKNMIKG